MAGRLLLSATLLLSYLGVSALPNPAVRLDDFFIGVPVSNPDITDAIPHAFIVVYNNTFPDDVVEAQQASIKALVAKRNINKRSPLTGKLLSPSVKSIKINQWRAMALEADDKMINEIYANEAVSYIEQDAVIRLNARLIQNQATTGLARISHSEPGSRGYIFDSSSGEGITAYVVDTGVRITHREFQGRATFGANFVDDVVRLFVCL